MSNHSEAPRKPKSGIRCICNWPDCAEFQTKLGKAGDVAAGYVRLRFDGKTSAAIQLQHAVHKLLHTPTQTRGRERPYVARHHWTREHLENNDSTGVNWNTPISKEKAKALLYDGQTFIDPILVFKEDAECIVSWRNAPAQTKTEGRHKSSLHSRSNRSKISC